MDRVDELYKINNIIKNRNNEIFKESSIKNVRIINKNSLDMKEIYKLGMYLTEQFEKIYNKDDKIEGVLLKDLIDTNLGKGIVIELDSFFIENKKESPKNKNKPIVIVTEKVINSNGVKARKILSIDNVLKKDDLPNEYLVEDANFIIGENYHGKVLFNKKTFKSKNDPCSCIHKDMIIDEPDYQYILKYIEECGKRLHEINQQIEKEKAKKEKEKAEKEKEKAEKEKEKAEKLKNEWNGKETFTI